MRRFLPCIAVWFIVFSHGLAQETVSVRLADAFGLPVGLDGAKQYFKARGFRPNGHLGEDWNGVGGGDTDLGDPVYCAARGFVVYARDFRAGWGNVVIVRHAYVEGGEVKFVDSLYGHLDRIDVREGQRLERGKQVGTIGTGHGHYPAHLHFEIRKDIRVGMFRSKFPRDFSTYYDPTQFITTHQTLPGESKVVAMPINTFPNEANFSEADKFVEGHSAAGDRSSPVTSNGKRMLYGGGGGLRWSTETGQVEADSPQPKGGKKGSFKVDRYEDIRGR